MKKIILLFLISVVPGLVSADVISQVSYNPSRIGQFSTLKAADRIVFLGGLVTPTLTVKKNTTFAWENNGTYVIQSIQAPSNGTLKLTDGVLQGWQSNIQTYDGSGIPTLPANPITLQVAGGNVSFGNSYVNNLVNGSIWRVYAGSVNVAALDISGTGGSQNLVNEGHNAGSESDGFRLAGGNIPYKDFGSDNLEWCEKSACRGSACSSTRTVSLLGYNCSGGSEPSPVIRYKWRLAYSCVVESYWNLTDCPPTSSGNAVWNGYDCSQHDHETKPGSNMVDKTKFLFLRQGNCCNAYYCAEEVFDPRL